MRKLNSIETKFVNEIDEEISEGVCYVSEKYSVAIFLCPCGCGLKTVIPFKPADQGKKDHFWQYWRNEDKVTFEPSMLNKFCPNGSHFYIRDNRIDWS